MEKYSNLLDYISFFEEVRKENEKCPYPEPSLAYVEYEKKLNKFTYDVSESDIMDHNYLSYFEYPNPPLSVENIETAGIDLLKAMFTYYIRQERFQEGLCLYAASEGIFLRLLYRLKALTCDRVEE
ncbi:MAG: DUF6508 domain-containing protein [Candidatus Cloacimonetes bacterium]|nr:DUF6508 domain-containing protein [Candidatus Cloacimonadota bacterium]